MTDVTISRLPTKIFETKRMTGNQKANKKEINQGDMQLASVARKKIAIKN